MSEDSDIKFPIVDGVPRSHNELTRVPTERTTAVPTAAVLTLVLHLLCTNCGKYVSTVPTVRERAINRPTAVQYVLRTDIRTNCTADVRTKKVRTAPTFCILYARTASTCTCWRCTYVY